MLAGKDGDAGAAEGESGGNDVPKIVVGDVEGEEISLAGAEADTATVARMAHMKLVAVVGAGLAPLGADLDTADDAENLDHEIVEGVLADGLGYIQAIAQGASAEERFGDLTFAVGTLEGWKLISC